LHRVVTRPEKIIPQKGKHQVGAISPWERGQNITDVCYGKCEWFVCSPIADLFQGKMKESL
jgi:hypothetical protein